MSTTNIDKWIIGGPGRSGKSLLAKLISSSYFCNQNYAVLKVDALFHIYLNRKKLISKTDKIAFIKEYLSRPRYMDPSNLITEKPVDAFEKNAQQIAETIAEKTSGIYPVELICEILSELAIEKGFHSWIALDVHPEFYYEKYRKLIPGLKIIILKRDPREVICASLYWRTYPERLYNSTRQIYKKLMLWCLSMEVGYRLSLKYPQDAFIVNIKNILINTDYINNYIKLNNTKKSNQNNHKKIDMYFNCIGQEEFLCPDMKIEKLLSEKELNFIKNISIKCSKYERTDSVIHNQIKYSEKCFLFLYKIVSLISNNSPVHARNIIDFIFFPIITIKNFGIRFIYLINKRIFNKPDNI